jgi:hypothetical protein
MSRRKKRLLQLTVWETPLHVHVSLVSVLWHWVAGVRWRLK